MSIDENNALARRFIDEIFLEGRPESVDELLTDYFTPHTWASTGAGKDDLKRAVTRVGAGLSDVSMTIEDVIAESDLVAVRLTASATQSGEFMGLPPAASPTPSARSASFASAAARSAIIGTGRPARHDASARGDARRGCKGT